MTTYILAAAGGVAILALGIALVEHLLRPLTPEGERFLEQARRRVDQVRRSITRPLI